MKNKYGLLMVFILFQYCFVRGEAEAAYVHMQLNDSELVVEEINEGNIKVSSISIPGFEKTNNLSQPVIPVKRIALSVPINSYKYEATCVNLDNKVIKINYELLLGKGDVVSSNNSKILSSEYIVPYDYNRRVEIVGTDIIGGFCKVVYLDIYPVSYIESNKTLY